MITAAYISRIESYLVGKLKSVSKNVYAGTLPSTLPTNQTTFVVVDCAAQVYDKNAYADSVVGIYLYATPSANKKNVSALYKMEIAFEEFLEDSDSDEYVVTEIGRKTDYDTSYNMHYIYVALNLIVK
jgi:hypothetical protein